MASLASSLRRMLLPLALGTLGTALLHAWISGQVQTLLHPLLHPLVAGAGLLLLLAAVLFLLLPLPERPLWKSGRDASLALVFLFALAAAPGSFSALALTNRTAADPSAVLRGKGAQAAEEEEALAWKPDSFGVIPLEVTDLYMAVGLPKSAAALEGKKVRLVGQTAPGKDGASFELVRFLMFCCAADAQPLALRVDGARPPELPNMGWAEAVGTVHFRDGDGAGPGSISATMGTPSKQVPVLTLESAKAIPEPKEKFLY